MCGAFDAGDFDDSRAGGLDFFDEFGGAEFVFGEVVDVGYWFAACALLSCVNEDVMRGVRDG